MPCWSCWSGGGASQTLDEKPAHAPPQAAASRPAPASVPAAVPREDPRLNGAAPSPTRPAAPARPQAAPASPAGGGQPRPSGRVASQLGHKDTPAFLSVDPRAPIGKSSPNGRAAGPAAVAEEAPAPVLAAEDLSSPPSFKGFLTPKAEEPAAALDDPVDSGDIWTPRNMGSGALAASTGSLRSLDRGAQSPASRPGSGAWDGGSGRYGSLDKPDVEAVRQRVRAAAAAAAASSPEPTTRNGGPGRSSPPARANSLGSGPHDPGPAGGELYELVGVLGEGRTGTTKLMRDRRGGELVAAKWVAHTAGETLSVETEREIVNHRRLLHANVVRFREVFATDEHLVIVMDYASGGHLAEAVDVGGPLPEARARDFFRQLVDGMVYCHRQGIVHRNLRAENVLLDGHVARPTLKISGFGYSKAPDLDSAPKSINMVSPAYLPPEMLMATRNEGSSYDGRAVDVWSAGVLLFYMLTGVQPFTDDAEPGVLNRKLVQRIVHCRYELPAGVRVSPECRNMLASIFVADPRQRIDSYSLPLHPWLAGTLLPKAEQVTISSQTESDISLVMERARKRRAARQAAQRASAAPQISFNEDLVDM